MANSENLQERIVIPVTANAELHASRFCLETCGLYDEAQEMALVATVMTTGKPTVAYFEGPEPQIQKEAVAPRVVMECKGPRKEYLFMGKLVCRGRANVDTI